jgi:hypothetical protein
MIKFCVHNVGERFMNLAKNYGKLYVLNARIKMQDVNRFDLVLQN